MIYRSTSANLNSSHRDLAYAIIQASHIRIFTRFIHIIAPFPESMCLILLTKSKSKPKPKKDVKKAKKPKSPPNTSDAMFEYCILKVPLGPIMASRQHGRGHFAGVDAAEVYFSDSLGHVSGPYDGYHAGPHQESHQTAGQRNAREQKTDERLESFTVCQQEMSERLTSVDNRLKDTQKGLGDVHNQVGVVNAKLDMESKRRADKEMKRKTEAELKAKFEEGQKQGREDEKQAQEEARRKERLFAEAEERGFRRAKDELEEKRLRAEEQGRGQFHERFRHIQYAAGEQEKPGVLSTHAAFEFAAPDHVNYDSHLHHGYYYTQDCPECRHSTTYGYFARQDAEPDVRGPSLGLPRPVRRPPPPGYTGRYEVCSQVNYYPDLLLKCPKHLR